MGYADWHFLVKDIKKNPKGFLVSLVVLAILFGIFCLYLSYSNHKKTESKYTKTNIVDGMFIGIVKENISLDEIRNAKNEGMKSVYDKLDNAVSLKIKETSREYSEVLNTIHKSYAMFMRLDDDSLRVRKCLDTQGKMKKLIKNPYYDIINDFEKGNLIDSSITKGDTTLLEKNLVHERDCSNFR